MDRALELFKGQVSIDDISLKPRKFISKLMEIRSKRYEKEADEIRRDEERIAAIRDKDKNITRV